MGDEAFALAVLAFGVFAAFCAVCADRLDRIAKALEAKFEPPQDHTKGD